MGGRHAKFGGNKSETFGILDGILSISDYNMVMLQEV
jgi:hypothetical protein